MIFRRGDIVMLAPETQRWRMHFAASKGGEAMVVSSYAESHSFYGDSSRKTNPGDYKLAFKDIGICAWYPSNMMTLIKRGPPDIIEQYLGVSEKRDRERGVE